MKGKVVVTKVLKIVKMYKKLRLTLYCLIIL